MISKIPEKLEIPLKKQAPKWKLALSDWVTPILSLLIPCVVLAIDQLIFSLTNSTPATWVVAIALPLLVLLKQLLTQGAVEQPSTETAEFPHSVRDEAPIFTQSGELIHRTVNPHSENMDPHQ